MSDTGSDSIGSEMDRDSGEKEVGDASDIEVEDDGIVNDRTVCFGRGRSAASNLTILRVEGSLD